MVKIYFSTTGGHLDMISSNPSGIIGEQFTEVPDDHEVLRNPEIYKFEDGVLIKDEEHQRQLIAEELAEESRPTDDEINAIALMQLTNLMLGGV